jgi:hypothetical protein
LLRPFAANSEVGEEGLGFHDTLSVYPPRISRLYWRADSHCILLRSALDSICSSAQVSDPLASPGSAISSTYSATPSQAQLTPTLVLEAKLLQLFLLSLPPAPSSPPPLIVTKRPSPLEPDQLQPFVSLAQVKQVLGDEARARGWGGEEVGAKAIYGLVGKRCLKIDRRQKEAAIGFDFRVERGSVAGSV